MHASANGRAPDYVHFARSPSVVIVPVVVSVILGMIRGKVVNVRLVDRTPLSAER
jgi:hypothetical protein